MRICLATPAPPRSRTGNRVTALRWSRILRALGHPTRIVQQYRGGPADLLVALHARKSLPSMECFRRLHPDRPLVLALTGTDLYDDVRRDPATRAGLDWAWRLVVLQSAALDELPPHLRPRARVIYQSCPPRAGGRKVRGVFQACVVGHLRPVKDPFRAARAARLVPSSSRLRVVQAGSPLLPEMAAEARAEEAANPRYRWLGGLPRGRVLELLSRSHLLVLTSLMEGGANVVCEALACGVPVLSSRISGSIGILGADYPGYFTPGDTQELARLLWRAESDPRWYEELGRWCQGLRHLVLPEREAASWRSLLDELSPGGPAAEASQEPPDRAADPGPQAVQGRGPSGREGPSSPGDR
jgi:putative glycosyltransferase (TIGR04348 family)